MRLFYIGGESVNSIAQAVARKYASFDIMAVTSLKMLEYQITRGEVIDRALVFDSFCDTTFCENYDKMTVRQQIQKVLGVIKNNPEACLECVCIAQTPLTTQYFVEELYENTYNTAVFSVDTKLPLSMILSYTAKSIAELRKTSCHKAQQDIYQSNDDVIWSDNKIVTSTWTQLGSENITVKLKDKFRLNVALDLLDFWLPNNCWEYKTDIQELKAQQQQMQTGNKNKMQIPIIDDNGRKLTRKERKMLKKQYKQERKAEKLRLKQERKRLKQEQKLQAKLEKLRQKA